MTYKAYRNAACWSSNALTTLRWLALPGSVGQPRDGNPAACYAMFDELTSLLTYWRVPYDHEQAARKVLEAGLPPHLATLLVTGGAQ